MSRSGSSRNYYEVLGVSPTAGAEEVKRAYRRCVLTYHPDVRGNRADMTQFRRVRRAYQVLSDPAERSRYDLMMGLGEHAGSARFYRRSFDLLFARLFTGLRAALSRTTSLSDEMEEEQRRRAG